MQLVMSYSAATHDPFPTTYGDGGDPFGGLPHFHSQPTIPITLAASHEGLGSADWEQVT